MSSKSLKVIILLKLFTCISVFVILIGLSAYISPVWIKISINGAEAGQGIAFSYFFSPRFFYFGANNFLDLPIKYQLAEIFFPIALFFVIVSIIRIMQTYRFLKVNPSQLSYARKMQYQSFGLHFAAIVLLALSLGLFTIEAVSSLNDLNFDFKELTPQLKNDLSMEYSDESQVSQLKTNSSGTDINNKNDIALLSHRFPLFKDKMFPCLCDKIFGSIPQPAPRRSSGGSRGTRRFSRSTDNDNFVTSIKYVLGFSFYLGWVTLLLEILAVAIYIPYHKNIISSSSCNEKVVLVL